MGVTLGRSATCSSTQIPDLGNHCRPWSPGGWGWGEGLDGGNSSDLGDGDRGKPPHSCTPPDASSPEGRPVPRDIAGASPYTVGMFQMEQPWRPEAQSPVCQQCVKASTPQTEAQSWAVAGIFSWPPHSEAGWEVVWGPGCAQCQGRGSLFSAQLPSLVPATSQDCKPGIGGVRPHGARTAAGLRFFGGMGGEEDVVGGLLWGPQARQAVEEPSCPLSLP